MAEQCCKKYFFVGGLAVSIYGWLFDFLVHGKLLMQQYTDTAALWRPQGEMQQFMPYCIAYHLAIGFLVTGGYFCWRKKITVGAVGSSECPYRKSMGFGLWLGLILGISASMTYVFLPMPGELALAWLAANVAKWTLAGILLQKLYHWKEKNQAA